MPSLGNGAPAAGPAAPTLCGKAMVVRGYGVFGSKLTATQRIEPGEAVFIEKPLAYISSQEEEEEEHAASASGEPALDTDEWKLAHALLARGCRAAWATSYVTTELGPSPASSSGAAPLVRQLAAAHGCSSADVKQVYSAVTNNALVLETPFLELKYGAAFYEVGSYLNHSCEPNALSIRMGGNLCVFAAEPIAKGDEILHSYIPMRLLLLSKKRRQQHLHFPCKCKRCESETSDESAELDALGFPAAHIASEGGRMMAEFKLTCSLSKGEPFEILRAFNNMAAAKGNWSMLKAHPEAALDVLDFYFNACFNAEVALSEAAQRSEPALAWRGAAAKLMVGATEQLLKHRLTKRHPAVAHLANRALVLSYLTNASVREITIEGVMRGMLGLDSMYGRALFIWLKDDAPCLELFKDLATPGLQEIADNFKKERTSGVQQASLPGFSIDVCTYCGKPENPSVDSGPFLRCSACKEVKYCSVGCQRKSWKAMHKICCNKKAK